MSKAAMAVIRRLVEDLVRGNYGAVEADGRIGRLTRVELSRAIAQYGRTLVSLPSDVLDAVDTYPSEHRPREFAVDVPLWTAEEGRSDLTLFLAVVDGDDGPTVTIDDLRVP